MSIDHDTLADVEGDCRLLYGLAGAEMDAPPTIRALVTRLLGSPPRFAPLAHEAIFTMVRGVPTIFVRRGTPPARARWLAGHELAHWWYDRRGYHGEDLEARCDALGAAIVAPRPAYLAARRRVGASPCAIAAVLGTTQSLALLREGELCGTPVALVRDRGAIVRGDDYGWPDEPTLRAVARRGHPGLRRVRITDEPRRVGLVAA